jgi:hypothetical protein
MDLYPCIVRAAEQQAAYDVPIGLDGQLGTRAASNLDAGPVIGCVPLVAGVYGGVGAEARQAATMDGVGARETP